MSCGLGIREADHSARAGHKDPFNVLYSAEMACISWVLGGPYSRCSVITGQAASRGHLDNLRLSFPLVLTNVHSSLFHKANPRETAG